jgi:hypothetical protein
VLAERLDVAGLEAGGMEGADLGDGRQLTVGEDVALDERPIASGLGEEARDAVGTGGRRRTQGPR